MPEPDPGSISKSELAEVATLFDAWYHALDPRSRVAKLAELRFERRVEELWEEKIQGRNPAVDLCQFRTQFKRECRKFLLKNEPLDIESLIDLPDVGHKDRNLP